MGVGSNWFGSRAGGKRGRGRRKENMGQSTISEKILIHLIYVLLE